MTVENYHLRWDSHLSHLNTSIATLYRNDKFADVLLYSSSPDLGFPRFGISAHKFILSSSSQFFASIFDSTLPATTSSGVFHIVLPPDLTQRTIQILVQYMYSGEATVPNDILSEVLRGGELLKIRGLCRASPINSEECHKSYPKSNPIESNNCPRFANELRGLGASVLPEESPVIVKSPKPPLRIVDCTTLSGGISVNKEVAIDPDPDEAKFPYPENTAQCPPAVVRSSCRESGCTGCPDRTDMDCRSELVQAPKLTMRTDLHHSSQGIENNSSAAHSVSYRRISLPLDPVTSVKPLRQPTPDEQANCFQIKEEPSDCWHVDQTNCGDAPAKVGVPKLVLKLKAPRETVPTPIKIEASTSGDDECSEPPLDNVERVPYTRLVCDLCKMSFDEPKAWVRHIESHTERLEADKDSDNSSSAFNQPPSKTSYVPKKRRRVSPHENPGAHVTLMCDLCTRSFSTPAEWVRHINTQHTESELAIFNNQRNTAQQQKPDVEVVRYSRRHHTGGLFKAAVRVFRRNKFISHEIRSPPARDLDKICDVCTKRFLTNSLMMDHKRTHPIEGDSFLWT